VNGFALSPVTCNAPQTFTFGSDNRGTSLAKWSSITEEPYVSGGGGLYIDPAEGGDIGDIDIVGVEDEEAVHLFPGGIERRLGMERGP
jgi:hypothetical protein